MDNRSEPSKAQMCGVPTCPRITVTLGTPLCEPHMIEAWRWVEAHPSVKPPAQVTDQPHPANIFVPEDRHVVFYAAQPDGTVRIGVTFQIKKRFRELGLRYPADLLASEPGGYVLKRRRVDQFAALTDGKAGRHVDTFARSADLVAHIDALTRPGAVS